MNTSTPNAFYGLVRARFAAARGILTLLLLAALAPVAVARTTILFEGFEGNFPGDNGWSVGDANATGGATNYWEVVSTPFGTGGTHTGSWKGYCARTKYGQSSTAPSPTYDNDMTSFMQRNIDLTGCGCATLEFWAFIPSIETCCDYLRVLVELQEVVRSPSETGGWIKINVDLNRAASRKQFPISFFQNPNQGSS